MNLISVIVPVYNVENYINRCVDSILIQDYDYLELILVNDGSTDKSGTICDEYALKDNRVKVIHKKNGGVSSARNSGLERAAGDYILFFDSDDWIDKDTISHLYNNLNNYNADCSICSYYINDKPVNTMAKRNKIEKLNKQLSIKKALLSDGYGGYLWNKLYKKNIIVEHNLKFNESITIGEDLLFTINYLIKCDTISYSDTPKYHYYYRKTSALNSSFNGKKLSSIEAYKEIIRLISSANLNLSSLAYSVTISSAVSLLIQALNSRSKIEYVDIITTHINNYSKYLNKNIYASKKLKIYVKLINFNPKLFHMSWLFLNRIKKTLS